MTVKSSEAKNFYFANPRAQYLALKNEVDQAISLVLNADSYVLGPQVELFENEFAAYLGQKYSVGVNSGTDALILSMRVLKIGRGDEVILPSFTAVATAAASYSRLQHVSEHIQRRLPPIDIARGTGQRGVRPESSADGLGCVA